METQLPKPDVVAVEVPIGQLDGTAKSIAAAAASAGWTVKASRSIGPRPPRTTGQAVTRVGTLALIGHLQDSGWRFAAFWNAVDGWDVVLARPGWGLVPSNITELRRTFAAMTPKRVA